MPDRSGGGSGPLVVKEEEEEEELRKLIIAVLYNFIITKFISFFGNLDYTAAAYCPTVNIFPFPFR